MTYIDSIVISYNCHPVLSKLFIELNNCMVSHTRLVFLFELSHAFPCHIHCEVKHILSHIHLITITSSGLYFNGFFDILLIWEEKAFPLGAMTEFVLFDVNANFRGELSI